MADLDESLQKVRSTLDKTGDEGKKLGELIHNKVNMMKSWSANCNYKFLLYEMTPVELYYSEAARILGKQKSPDQYQFSVDYWDMVEKIVEKSIKNLNENCGCKE